MRDQLPDCPDLLAAALADNAKLAAENAVLLEALKEARRYQFLRECDQGEVIGIFDGYDGIRGAELDAKIDAAITKYGEP